MALPIASTMTGALTQMAGIKSPNASPSENNNPPEHPIRTVNGYSTMSGIGGEISRLFKGYDGYGVGFKQNLFSASITIKQSSGKKFSKYLKEKMHEFLLKPYTGEYTPPELNNGVPVMNNGADTAQGVDSDTFTWSGICVKARVGTADMTDINPWGNERMVVSKAKDNMTLDFMDDQYGVNSMFWRIFGLWQIDENTGIMHFKDDAYISNLKVSLLDPFTTVPYMDYEFKNCIPKSTPEINLDSSTSGVVTFSIGFGYSEYKITKSPKLLSPQESVGKIYPLIGNNPLAQTAGGLFARLARAGAEAIAPGALALFSNPFEVAAIADALLVSAAGNIPAIVHDIREATLENEFSSTAGRHAERSVAHKVSGAPKSGQSATQDKFINLLLPGVLGTDIGGYRQKYTDIMKTFSEDQSILNGDDRKSIPELIGFDRSQPPTTVEGRYLYGKARATLAENHTPVITNSRITYSVANAATAESDVPTKIGTGDPSDADRQIFLATRKNYLGKEEYTKEDNIPTKIGTGDPTDEDRNIPLKSRQNYLGNEEYIREKSEPTLIGTGDPSDSDRVIALDSRQNYLGNEEYTREDTAPTVLKIGRITIERPA